MSEEHADVEPLRVREVLTKALADCVKADLWGQVVEAVEGYEALVAKVINTAPNLELSPEDDSLLHGLVCVLKARCQVLTLPTPPSNPGPEDMKRLSKALEELFIERTPKAFPVDITWFPEWESRFWQNEEEKKLDQPAKPGGLLIPRPSAKNGEKHISVEILDIGIKDAENFVNPFIRLTVLNPAGDNVELKQETPFAEKQIRYRVDFNTIIHVQTPLEELSSQDAGIFFEFVHFKERKRKNSTRCWALLEADEYSQPGEKLLELYQKPIHKTRKNFKLLTSKKLYLRIRVIASS